MLGEGEGDREKSSRLTRFFTTPYSYGASLTTSNIKAYDISLNAHSHT